MPWGTLTAHRGIEPQSIPGLEAPVAKPITPCTGSRELHPIDGAGLVPPTHHQQSGAFLSTPLPASPSTGLEPAPKGLDPFYLSRIHPLRRPRFGCPSVYLRHVAGQRASTRQCAAMANLHGAQSEPMQKEKKPRVQSELWGFSASSRRYNRQFQQGVSDWTHISTITPLPALSRRLFAILGIGG